MTIGHSLLPLLRQPGGSHKNGKSHKNDKNGKSHKNDKNGKDSKNGKDDGNGKSTFGRSDFPRQCQVWPRRNSQRCCGPL